MQWELSPNFNDCRMSAKPLDWEHGCNRVLGFDGLYLGEDGKFRRVAAASTISEALRLAGQPL